MRNDRNKPKRYVHEFAHDVIRSYMEAAATSPAYEKINFKISRITRIVASYDKGQITSLEAVKSIVRITEEEL